MTDNLPPPTAEELAEWEQAARECYDGFPTIYMQFKTENARRLIAYVRELESHLPQNQKPNADWDRFESLRAALERAEKAETRVKELETLLAQLRAD